VTEQLTATDLAVLVTGLGVAAAALIFLGQITRDWQQWRTYEKRRKEVHQSFQRWKERKEVGPRPKS
jgi:hypothetical protein